MAPEKKIKLTNVDVVEEDTLSVSMPDWSLLPPELLHLISECLRESFDAAIHARSVCNPWRSAFSYPSSVLSRTTYSLPPFDDDRSYCTLLNFHVFLFIHRDPTSLHSEFLMGGIVRGGHVEFPSLWSDPTPINICDYQIVPLGRQYKMVGDDRETFQTEYQAAACLPLTKMGGGDFVVLLGYDYDFFLLTSAEMSWKRLNKRCPMASCKDIVTFRGRFYAVLDTNELFIIDPYSLKLTPLLPPPPLELEDYCGIGRYLVPSGDDELYLVEKIRPCNVEKIGFARSVNIVSRLDEETGEWVMVSDLGDRVLLIGPPGNRTCLGKDLPDGCSLSGNSIFFIDMRGIEIYKYGVDTRLPRPQLWEIHSTESCDDFQRIS